MMKPKRFGEVEEYPHNVYHPSVFLKYQQESQSSDGDLDEDVIIDANLIWRKNQLYIRKRGFANQTKVFQTIKQILNESEEEEEEQEQQPQRLEESRRTSIHMDFEDRFMRNFQSKERKIKKQEQNQDIQQQLLEEKMEIETINEYAQLSQRDPHTDYYNCELTHIEGWDEITQNHHLYEDKLPLLKFRKYIVLITSMISLICYRISTNKQFTITMLFLVTINMGLYITKLYEDYYTIYKSLFDGTAVIFFIVYIIEHTIKIIGLGLVDFLKQFWYVYDLINLITYGLYIYGILWIDLSPLRAARILIFLGQMFASLQIMLSSLSKALLFMVQSCMIVIILAVFFANVGLHLFKGVLQNACVDFDTGIVTYTQCGYLQCPSGGLCFQSLQDPDVGTSFNNFPKAFAQIIRIITMDNWTQLMYYMMYTYSSMAWVYFVCVIYIVGFFSFNMIIAILRQNYKRIMAHPEEVAPIAPAKISLNLRYIKSIGIYGTIKTLQKLKKKQQTETSLNVIGTTRMKNIFTPSHERTSLVESKKINNLLHTVTQQTLSNKMVKRAQSIKQKKQQKLFLSARQQYNYDQKMKLGQGVVAQNMKWKLSVKNILLPHRKFTLENFSFDSKLKEDFQGRQILQTLQTNDILAWKLSVKYDHYTSTSEKDIFQVEKVILNKQLRDQQFIKDLRQLRLKHYYLFNFNLKKKLAKTITQEMITLKQQSLNIKIPMMKSERLSMLKGFESTSQVMNMGSSRSITLKQQFKTQQSKKQLYKKAQSYNKRKTESYIEFPIWKKGEPYISVNGVKWNFVAVQMIISKKLEDDSEESDEEMNYPQKYISLREEEVQQKQIQQNNISIFNVIRGQKLTRLLSMIRRLNEQDSVIWLQGSKGMIMMIQSKIFRFLNNQIVQIVLDGVVLANLLLLCLMGLIGEGTLDLFDQIFTFLQISEMFIRMLSVGPKQFAKSNEYIFNCTILAFSLIEIIVFSAQPSWLSRFNSETKALRAFKCLLVYRIARYNDFTVSIMKIAYRTIQQFLNLMFLLAFVIFLYAILGMQLFGNKTDQLKQSAQMHSFDSLVKAMITVFDIQTNDDAYGNYQVGAEYTNQWLSLTYYLALVFIINYMIFGLVTAVLLDEFSSDLQKGQMNPEKDIIDQKAIGIKDNIVIQSHNTLKTAENNAPQPIAVTDSRRSIISRTTIGAHKLPEQAKHLFTDKRKSKLYQNVFCEQSLFIFSKNSRFRIMCYRLVKHPIFKSFLNIVICSSVAAMIYISFDRSIQPLHQYNSFNNIFQYHLALVNIIIGLAYMAEIIALGMIVDEGAFCRDLWRFIDILYLLSYYCSFFIPYPFFLKALYMIYLRPLMMINMFESVQGVKNAMARSLMQIFNVICVVLVVLTIFSVFGIHLFSGKLGYCNNNMNFHVSYTRCISRGGTWSIYPYNFENLFQAMVNLFVIATYDGWGQNMQACWNSRSAEHGPSPFFNQWATYLFFICYVFVGAMFFMEFLKGMLFSQFQSLNKQLKNKFLTTDQSQFIDICELIIKKTPNYSSPPKSFLRRTCSLIIFNSYYKQFFIVILLMNTVVLSLIYEGASFTYMRNINLVYQIMSWVFIFDTVMKILAYGPARYLGINHYILATNWRLIELLLSALTLFDFIFDRNFNWFESYLAQSTVGLSASTYRIFLAFRNFRVLLIIQEFQGLLRLMRVLEFSFHLLLKILYIYLITLTCYALIGCQLNSQVNSGNIMDSNYINFNNFLNSGLIMFKVTSGDDWRNVLIDTTDNNPNCRTDPTQCGSYYSYPFLISYYFLSFYIIMSLFILVLVDQFEEFFSQTNNVIQEYVESIDNFCNCWCRYSYDYDGKAMHTRFVARFLLTLGQPLGCEPVDNVWDAAKMASHLRLRSNEQHCIDFNELLYEVIRFHLKRIFKEGDPIGISQMKEFDREMRNHIKKKKIHQDRSNSIIVHNKYEYNNFNILSEYINVLVTLKTWIKFTEKKLNLARLHEDIYTEVTDLSDTEQEQSPQPEKVKVPQYATYRIQKPEHNVSELGIEENEQQIKAPSLMRYKIIYEYRNGQKVTVLQPTESKIDQLNRVESQKSTAQEVPRMTRQDVSSIKPKHQYQLKLHLVK